MYLFKLFPNFNFKDNYECLKFSKSVLYFIYSFIDLSKAATEWCFFKQVKPNFLEVESDN